MGGAPEQKQPKSDEESLSRRDGPFYLYADPERLVPVELSHQLVSGGEP
jgi:hypothetical protein